MSIRNLEPLLSPRSVAVIGASSRPQRVGTVVLRNLIQGGFAGAIYPVNPKYDQIQGLRAYARVEELPAAPDLAVICTPPSTVPGLVERLGARGTRAAIVITAGLDRAHDDAGRSLGQAMLDAARPHLVRILGPNCVGLLVPGIKLNASFAHTDAAAGNIAFISQSGALVTATLDWAKARGVGFSHFVSLGEGADVDFADLIDYLGSDANTRAILLYIESIRTARKFVSAARAAARNKPLLVVKAGRAPEGARAAASHTGALAGSDAVFDAAIRRAGMLRVDTLRELFDAVETISHNTRFAGERLAIMTNGGGAGVLAADALSLAGGKLCDLAPETLARLDAALPSTWSRANPVDIIGDAPVERYVQTFDALAQDPQVDAILFLHAPTAIVAPDVIARGCVPAALRARKPVLSCWLGQHSVEGARQVFHDAGIADFPTPEDAVRAFMQLVDYRKNQDCLLQTPSARAEMREPDTQHALQVIQTVLREGREILTELEAKAVLRAYRIPVVETRLAHSVDDAVQIAGELGFPVALKIQSSAITHKSDVGGVALDLQSGEAVKNAAAAMAERVGALRPDATLTGFTVQPMVRKPRAHELIAGTSIDPVFGPVILFGQGGTAVEVIGDRAVALPPLNVPLACDLVSRTRIAKLLAGYRDRPAADLDAIYAALCALSQLLIDLPQVMELDINPLLADDQGVLALDARILVREPTDTGRERLAIRPYPRELEEQVPWQGRTLVMRPIRPEDTDRHLAFLRKLTPEDMRLRFFYTRRYIPPSELARLTQIDYEREMAFVAIPADGDDAGETLGVVRAVTDPENAQAEFAIVVRSDLKGHGLGRLLFEKIIRYCRSRGTRELVGDVLRENKGMLTLARDQGFATAPSLEMGTMRVTLDLQK